MGEKIQDAAGAERLFPFVLRSRKLLVGRERLLRRKRELQWVLITTDISEGSRAEMLRDFRDYPIVQRYTTRELEQFFSVRGAKVVGFAKSGLAKSIYAGLKDHRINKPAGEDSKPKKETGGKSGKEV